MITTAEQLLIDYKMASRTIALWWEDFPGHFSMVLNDGWANLIIGCPFNDRTRLAGLTREMVAAFADDIQHIGKGLP
jgi:hypothetical protein